MIILIIKLLCFLIIFFNTLTNYLLLCLITESGLSVEMNNIMGVNEGYGLMLTCKVHGVKGQLSVTWQRKSTSAAIFTKVISLSQEGVVEKAEEFRSRKVKATRSVAGTFNLELDEVRPSDAGVYECAVSEWESNSKTNSQSQMATVTVAPSGKTWLSLCGANYSRKMYDETVILTLQVPLMT